MGEHFRMLFFIFLVTPVLAYGLFKAYECFVYRFWEFVFLKTLRKTRTMASDFEVSLKSQPPEVRDCALKAWAASWVFEANRTALHFSLRPLILSFRLREFLYKRLRPLTFYAFLMVLAYGFFTSSLADWGANKLNFDKLFEGLQSLKNLIDNLDVVVWGFQMLLVGAVLFYSLKRLSLYTWLYRKLWEYAIKKDQQFLEKSLTMLDENLQDFPELRNFLEKVCSAALGFEIGKSFVRSYQRTVSKFSPLPRKISSFLNSSGHGSGKGLSGFKNLNLFPRQR